MNAQEASKVIASLRARLNLSQEELAARLDVSFATVNRWEQGKSKPQQAKLESLLTLAEEAGIDAAAPEATPPAPPSTTDQSARRRRGIAHSAVLGTRSMEQMLWDAACQIRGEKDAPKFKDYLLPLLFLKRLSDVFDDEVQRLTETYGDRDTALSIIDADHGLVRFYLPPECRWPVVSGRETFRWSKQDAPKTLGEQLTLTVRATDGTGQIQTDDFQLPQPNGASGRDQITVSAA
jgi:type I restriction enzyme M protein